MNNIKRRLLAEGDSLERCNQSSQKFKLSPIPYGNLSRPLSMRKIERIPFLGKKTAPTLTNNITDIAPHPKIFGPKTSLKLENFTVQVNLAGASMKNMRILGKAWKKIIIVYDINLKCLFVVDQHAIHERIRYEILTEALQIQLGFLKSTRFIDSSAPMSILKGKLNSGKNEDWKRVLSRFSTILEDGYVQPVKASLRGMETKICLKDITLELENWGFKIQPSLDKEGIICQLAPLVLGHRIPKEKIALTIAQLIQNQRAIPAEIDKFLMDHSCKGAIKFNGDLPDRGVIKILFRTLAECRHPFQCVHGRNSFISVGLIC